jgi:hypothetical protein
LTSEFCLKHISGDADADYDLVFVHGLIGDPVGTWSFDGTDSDKCYWPKWFGVYRPDIRIFALGYPAVAFVPWAKCEKKELTLFELAIGPSYTHEHRTLKIG